MYIKLQNHDCYRKTRHDAPAIEQERTGASKLMHDMNNEPEIIKQYKTGLRAKAYSDENSSAVAAKQSRKKNGTYANV